MTNEEARAYFIDSNERIISVAKDENRYNYEKRQIEDVFMRRTFEANELAIKALKQEPCDDCISREAALDDSGLGEFHRYDDYVKMRNYLKSLPSVLPQPKVGRWVVLKDEYDDICEAVCSCCDKNGNHKWAFCPNCGAKMSEIQTGAEGSEE